MLMTTDTASEAVPYVYVLIREDLTPEQQLVQAAHAALAAGSSFGPISPETHLVVLQVPNEAALLGASAALRETAIAHELFFEPDDEGGYSALASAPLTERLDRRAFRRFPLFRSRSAATARS